MVTLLLQNQNSGATRISNENSNVKRIFMKKYARFLVAVALLLGLRVAANAEIQPQVVVTLPFEFVVSGKTLPADTYTVKRFLQQPFDALMLTSDAMAPVCLSALSRWKALLITSPK
jgi:hypothetical protein